MIYGFDFKPPAIGHISDMFETCIKTVDPFESLSLVIRVAGIVDFVLRQLVYNYRLSEFRLPVADAMFDWPEEIKVINQQKILQLDLQEAHAKRALEAWTKLRANALSHQSLIDHLVRI
eukprot:gene10627-10698_t